MPAAIPTSPIVDFFNDARIFITGGTGFVGKALIEKLLRACPNIDHIYILIRVKKNKDPETRLKELFGDFLFSKLRTERPDFEKKITCIPGDISSVGLSISESDYKLLTREVTHVFHSAATVRFNEALKSAVSINVCGTREVIKLCKDCTQLKVFVHVSTAFCHCFKIDSSEEFYDPPLTTDKVLNLIDSLTEEKLNAITPELIKPWPNTYTYTKAIAESVVKEEANSFPTVIFRPAIVMGSYREPLHGWIDNIYGPTGVVVAVGLGLMRTFIADTHVETNIVPVDLTVNGIIACAWDTWNNCNKYAIANSIPESNDSTGLVRKTENLQKIFNFTSDRSNSITWGKFLDITLKIGSKYPSNKTIWYYTITLTTTNQIYTILSFILHYIPGFLMDIGFILVGKKPQMITAYHKIDNFVDVTKRFSMKSWNFCDMNTKKVWTRLSEKDKDLFYFDMRTMDWTCYLGRVVYGIRHYLLKESEQTLNFAKKKLFFLWLAHRVLQFIFLGISIWILSKVFFTFFDVDTQFKTPILMHLGNST